MQWKNSNTPVDYAEALRSMEQRVDDILTGKEQELIWTLEHPPLYTAGSSAKPADLADSKRFPVYQTGRGGEWTYHGPGQRVAYVMLDLKKRNAEDVRAYVQRLEEWLIRTLARFGIEGGAREGRIGVWVNTPQGEAKIAALGIRVRKWITYHGISLNVNPDLSHYTGIVPCGIRNFGVTSLASLGVTASMADIDKALKEEFTAVFG